MYLKACIKHTVGGPGINHLLPPTRLGARSTTGAMGARSFLSTGGDVVGSVVWFFRGVSKRKLLGLLQTTVLVIFFFSNVFLYPVFFDP